MGIKALRSNGGKCLESCGLNMSRSSGEPILKVGIRTPIVSDTRSKEAWVQDIPSSSGEHKERDEQMAITSIRATGFALGLRRFPAGCYIAAHHSGHGWQTETKRLSVHDEFVEWSGLILIPSDLSAMVCLEVFASFEFQHTLGAGEHLRESRVERLSDHSAEDIPFTFIPNDRDIVSPCSSILVTIKRCAYKGNDPSALTVLEPRRSTTETSPELLEEATNFGHSSLSRYRRDGRIQDLECSIREFQQALNICPIDHPGLAAAQANLATAKFILCLVNNMNGPFEVPLRLYSNVLPLRPVGYSDRPSTLIQLVAVHFVRFRKDREEFERKQAEAFPQETVEFSPRNSHENRAATLMLQLHARCTVGHILADGESTEDSGSRSMDENSLGLCTQLLARFERFGDLDGLQQAISILLGFIRIIPVSDYRYHAISVNLGTALTHRFDHLGNLADLEEAISRFREAVDLIPHGHPNRPTCLTNLGAALASRFERFGQLADIEDAISAFGDAVDLSPRGHPDLPNCVHHLSTCFYLRFGRLGEQVDIEIAISVVSKAIDLTPRGHPRLPMFLNTLGSAFKSRFEHMGELSDLEHAISALKDAINLTPRGHLRKPMWLNSLSNIFQVRFQHLGELADLEDAILMLRQAIDLTPDGHPERPRRLENLGNCFLHRFRCIGHLSDLNLAISMHKDAIDLIPHGHPDKPRHLSHLGNCLFIRFQRFGDIGDLEDAIWRHGDAVHFTPDGHYGKLRFLQNLGCSLEARFKLLGELSDLEDAISSFGGTIDLIPHGHPDKPASLHNLGSCFFTRFQRLGELSDIDNAISRTRDAVDLTPDGHPEKPVRLSSLGNALEARFEYFAEPSDLENAIMMHRNAANLTPLGHPQQSTVLVNLGRSYSTRFRRLGELSNMEDAVAMLRDATALTPDSHFDRPTYLALLGDLFVARFGRLGELNDIACAISVYAHAASSPIGRVIHRFHASHRWLRCARYIHHHSLLRACSAAVDLLPRLAWVGLSLADRYSQLKLGANVVREAAATALNSGFPATAVEWLEQGRSIVWGELLQLRGSYEELLAAHPDYAHRLQELSSALENASSIRENALSMFSEQGRTASQVAVELPRREADKHRALAIKRDKLLQEIRRFPGFEQFLLRKEFSQLRALARSGPVVILNAAESRCDALVVLSGVDHVVHVPLPHFTLARCRGLQSILKNVVRNARGEREGKREPPDEVSWESFLAPLWMCVVKPILGALAFSTPGDLSRIFWCPTGPFAFLPLHAAGLYDDQHSQPGHKVYDFVVSSYVPTLSIFASSPNSSVVPNDSNLRLLAVRQPPSDGLPKLPGVHTELELIQDVIQNASSAHTILLEPTTGTVEQVLSSMREADWVHFACHGIQDAANPARSGLCLADGRRLKVSDMVGLSRPTHGGGLAFLSACQTATGDEDLSDEAIHIAAGMLFAGYEGVIGTMWLISDAIAPEVARDVYARLFGNGMRPDCREAAWALHEAIGRLRESGDAAFDEWIPFIHVGL